jgi:hypothetical protein
VEVEVPKREGVGRPEAAAEKVARELCVATGVPNALELGLGDCEEVGEERAEKDAELLRVPPCPTDGEGARGVGVAAAPRLGLPEAELERDAEAVAGEGEAVEGPVPDGRLEGVLESVVEGVVPLLWSEGVLEAVGAPIGEGLVGEAACDSPGAMMVDSTPAIAAPPSTMRSMRGPSPVATCAAVVGLKCSDGLAEGAARGRPTREIISSVAMCCGMRRPIEGRPAVARSCTGQSGLRGSTRVSGPGQKRSARRRASGVKCASDSAIARLAPGQMSGLKEGRPFAVKIAATAAPFVASAATP